MQRSCIRLITIAWFTSLVFFSFGCRRTPATSTPPTFTSTPAVSNTPTVTPTPAQPTFTPTMTDTPTPLPTPTATPSPTATPTPCPETVFKPANAIEISVLVPSLGEEWPDNYWTTVINRFNRAQVCGLDPATLQPAAATKTPIWVVARAKSSGEAAQEIIDAMLQSDGSKADGPTIYVPELRFWLDWINFRAGSAIVDTATPATTYSPIVIAIWQSRLAALQSKHPNQPLGWQELIQLFDAPYGWRDYGLKDRDAIYYGHADPNKSSVGLATLFAEFYASALSKKLLGDTYKLSSNMVNDPEVQNHVRRIESATKHYFPSSEQLRRIVNGPDYLDFVALPENDLLTLWQEGFEGVLLPTDDQLVAFYPKEGVFFYEHPLAILKAPWVTREQIEAANVFSAYMRSKAIQTLGMVDYGFRPAIDDLDFECTLCQQHGIDPTIRPTTLPLPAPIVAQTMLESWQLVKKQADIMLLIDVSNSMTETAVVQVSETVTRTVRKMDEAKAAIKQFIQEQNSATRIGLIAFSDTPTQVQPLCTLEECRDTLLGQVEALQPGGTTALYDALSFAITTTLTSSTDDTRIRAIILLSDGQNTTLCRSDNCRREKEDIRKAILNTQETTKAPLLVIPILYAYGSDDPEPLDMIARTSGMNRAIRGDVNQIRQVLADLGSYFSTTVAPGLQIALAANQSGDKQSIGLEQVAGAQYAVAGINQQNGIYGLLLAPLLIKDTASDTSVDQRELEDAFQQLNESSVLAIVGPGLSEQMFAISQTLRSMTTLVIGPSTTAPGVPQLGEYVLRVSAPVADYAHFAIRAVLEAAEQAKQPLTKVAVAYAIDDAFSRAEATILSQAVTQTYGLTLTTVQQFRTTDVQSNQIRGDEFERQIEAILATKPDLVIVSGLTVDGGSFIKQLRIAGYQGQIIGGNGLNTFHLFPYCRPHCKGILIAQAYNPELETTSNQSFVKIYVSQIGENDYPYPTQFTAQAYTAVQIIADALRALVDNDKIDDLSQLQLDDPEQVTKVRTALKDQLLSGMRFETPLGEIWFDKEGEVHQANFYVAQIIINDEGSEQFDIVAHYSTEE